MPIQNLTASEQARVDGWYRQLRVKQGSKSVQAARLALAFDLSAPVPIPDIFAAMDRGRAERPAR